MQSLPYIVQQGRPGIERFKKKKIQQTCSDNAHNSSISMLFVPETI